MRILFRLVFLGKGVQLLFMVEMGSLKKRKERKEDGKEKKKKNDRERGTKAAKRKIGKEVEQMK